jgi:hypothetical protein
MATGGMTRTLTIRLPGPALRRVRARARALGITPSELVRTLLEGEAGASDREPSALALTRRWVGAVSSRRADPGATARAALDAWDPDRRG